MICCAATFWKTVIFPITCFVQEIKVLFQFLFHIILTKKLIKFFKKLENRVLGSYLVLFGQKLVKQKLFQNIKLYHILTSSRSDFKKWEWPTLKIIAWRLWIKIIADSMFSFLLLLLISYKSTCTNTCHEN